MQSNKNQNMNEKRAKEMELLKTRMGKIRHKIAVISGKGGVGKSLVTVNLAVSLALKGRKGKVGVLDADLHGPSVPTMLGLGGYRLESGPPGIFPAIGPMDIKTVSMDFLLPSEDSPVIWRGPLKMSAIRQFLSQVVWGSLDYLLVDLPPGTGDESLSVLQLISDIDGVVIVTIPSEVSQHVVRKAVTFARKMDKKIIGIIENMSGLICPHCGKEIKVFNKGGGEKIAREMGVPFLGSIPLDPRISEASDAGKPFIIESPETIPAKSFKNVVDKIEEFVEK